MTFARSSALNTDVRDSAPDNWASKQTTVTATPRNGYTGGVRLALEFDEGITAELGKRELQFASPASTTLTLTPKPDTHGSPHSATLRAYDSNGRLVVGGARKPALARDLSLTTQPKPATENTAVNVTESETKPSESGETYYIPSSRKEIGAMGGLYDKATGGVISRSRWIDRPELRITDRGLVDVKQFKLVSLIADSP